MMIKSVQQLNQEFMEEHIARIVPAEPAPFPEAAAEVSEAPYMAGDETPKARETGRVSERTKRGPSLWKDLMYLVIKVTAILLALVLLFTFLFGVLRYQDPHMHPAIKDGDMVIFYRSAKNGYLPGDAVVLKIKGQKQVRRVIATAGDMVDISEGGLYINGALQQEADIYQRTERYAEGTEFPLTVPEGQVFLLGDSRIGATDSRIFGCVDIKDTLGKVMAVIRRRSV